MSSPLVSRKTLIYAYINSLILMAYTISLDCLQLPALKFGEFVELILIY